MKTLIVYNLNNGYLNFFTTTSENPLCCSNTQLLTLILELKWFLLLWHTCTHQMANLRNFCHLTPQKLAYLKTRKKRQILIYKIHNIATEQYLSSLQMLIVQCNVLICQLGHKKIQTQS